MSNPGRSLLDWVILGLLAALVVTNVALLILLWTGGSLFGLAFYLVLLALTICAKQRDHHSVLVGGLVGLAVHVLEVATMGWSVYPVLMVLNLGLPAGLALAAWVADREPRRVAGDR